MTGPAPYRQTYWDWRAAGNFIFGGTGSGVLLAAPFIAFVEGPVRLFVVLGLAFISAGLGLVWHETGKRLRAMNVFRHPNLSWMTRESYAALAVIAAGGITIILPGLAFSIITALFAGLFLYCQGRILKASKGIPAWREPAVVLLVIVTGIAEGICILMVVPDLLAAPLARTADPKLVVFFLYGVVLSRDFMFNAGLALIAALLLRIIVWRHYRAEFSKSAPIQAVRVYDDFDRRFVIAAGIVPALVMALALVFPALSKGLFLTAASLGLFGGWAFKYTLIVRASYTQGFAIPRRPARGPRGSGGAGAKPGWTSNG